MLDIRIDPTRERDLDPVDVYSNAYLDMQIHDETSTVLIVLLPVLGPVKVEGKPEKLVLYPDNTGFLRIPPFALRKVAQTSQVRFVVYEYDEPKPHVRATGLIDLIPVSEPDFWPGAVPPEALTYKGEIVLWQFEPLFYASASLTPPSP